MAKKVSFGVKLGSHPLACNADEWLQQPANADENPTTEPMKRPTLDVPEAFHRQLKIAAVSQNMAMADLIREWIRNGLRAYPKTGDW
ncbi:MAG TPA: hypothetical protein VES89_09435 [Candidatus Competibacteraceae bacterium]|nr:hypothetical protein [Candidatus Competibacteraceae bacterium]